MAEIMDSSDVGNMITDEGKVKLKALAGVIIKILGTELKAEVEKKEKGYAVLLIPTEPGNASEVSVQDMIDSVGKMFGGKENVDTSELETLINNSQPQGVAEAPDLSKIKIKLNMAFLYIDNDGEKNTDVEFAFHVIIKLDGLIPEGLKTFIDLGDAEVAVWSTDRKKIIDAMHLMKPEDYLKDE